MLNSDGRERVGELSPSKVEARAAVLAPIYLREVQNIVGVIQNRF